MRRLILNLLLIPGLVLAVVSGVQAEPKAQESIQKFQYKSALEASQGAIDTVLSDWSLTDADGKALSVSDFRGKPLVLSLVYTSCYTICPTTTRYLAGVVEKARETLGEDSFSVAVLGFDARYDTPLAMKQFARKQGIEDSGWYLLSADTDTINGFSKELGFEFFTSPNGFDHIVQTTVIDSDGRIYRQVYGETFATPLLIEPLLDLVLGQPKPNQSIIDELITRVRFFCTTYDPALDAYHFDYSLFIGMIIGALIILSTAGFIVREYLRGRHPRA